MSQAGNPLLASCHRAAAFQQSCWSVPGSYKVRAAGTKTRYHGEEARRPAARVIHPLAGSTQVTGWSDPGRGFTPRIMELAPPFRVVLLSGQPDTWLRPRSCLNWSVKRTTLNQRPKNSQSNKLSKPAVEQKLESVSYKKRCHGERARPGVMSWDGVGEQDNLRNFWSRR